MMNTDNFIIYNDNHSKLCKAMLKVLNCNLLWIINLNNSLLNILVTDKPIWEHYWDKKYYLHDPSLNRQWDDDPSPWKVTLGTDCDTFNKTGFLYDLHKIFNVEEFASIEKKAESGHYCFRFFTGNNRFVFMNNLLNDMPLIKYFINIMTEKFKPDLQEKPGINLTELKPH